MSESLITEWIILRVMAPVNKYISGLFCESRQLYLLFRTHVAKHMQCARMNEIIKSVMNNRLNCSVI